jgi:hypothetical protein
MTESMTLAIGREVQVLLEELDTNASTSAPTRFGEGRRDRGRADPLRAKSAYLVQASAVILSGRSVVAAVLARPSFSPLLDQKVHDGERRQAVNPPRAEHELGQNSHDNDN